MPNLEFEQVLSTDLTVVLVFFFLESSYLTVYDQYFVYTATWDFGLVRTPSPNPFFGISRLILESLESKLTRQNAILEVVWSAVSVVFLQVHLSSDTVVTLLGFLDVKSRVMKVLSCIKTSLFRCWVCQQTEESCTTTWQRNCLDDEMIELYFSCYCDGKLRH